MDARQLELYENIVGHCEGISEQDQDAIFKVMEGLEDFYLQAFENLYLKLNKADIGDDRFCSWMNYLKRPPFWRIKAKEQYNKVRYIFAEHGLALMRADSEKFRYVRITRPQRMDEDAGGAIIRQLRETFTYQYLLQIGILQVYR